MNHQNKVIDNLPETLRVPKGSFWKFILRFDLIFVIGLGLLLSYLYAIEYHLPNFGAIYLFYVLFMIVSSAVVKIIWDAIRWLEQRFVFGTENIRFELKYACSFVSDYKMNKKQLMTYLRLPYVLCSFVLVSGCVLSLFYRNYLIFDIMAGNLAFTLVGGMDDVTFMMKHAGRFKEHLLFEDRGDCFVIYEPVFSEADSGQT